jgi:hypothetical protein
MHVQRISYGDDDMDRFVNEKEKTSYELNVTAKWRHVGYPEEHTVLLAIGMHAESAHAWRQDGPDQTLSYLYLLLDSNFIFSAS